MERTPSCLKSDQDWLTFRPLINFPEMKPFLLFLLLFAGPILATNGKTSSGNGSAAEGSTKRVIVPQVVGYTLDQAKGILSVSHLRVGTVVQKLSTVPAGQVIAQDPQAGMKVGRESTVHLTVSVIENVLMVSVPDVKGMNLEKATEVMQDAGLTVDQIYYKISMAKEETVFKQQPAAGEPVKAGTPVFLMVSRHKHLAAWMIWLTVLIVLILNESLFKWKARRELKNHFDHPDHQGKK
jgi:hypothetical protein